MAIRDIESHPNQPPLSARPASPAHLETDGQIKGLEELKEEIDRVEAANVPLPLAEKEEDEGEVAGKGKGKTGRSPFGPL